MAAKKKKKTKRKTARAKPKKALVIVESPAKARTIHKYLGRGYLVRHSLGHVRDLPPKTLGVDVERGFRPTYHLRKGARKVIKRLREGLSEATVVLLATDPDREGEAIAWHLAEVTKSDQQPYYRVVFHEITEDAVKHAFQHPRSVDMQLVDAQQARRVLDRLVG